MRLPLVPTAMVALGVPVLLALGFWQLDRRQEKAAAIAAFSASSEGRFECAPLEGPVEQRGGRSRAGQTGYSHFAQCMLGGEAVRVDLGWTARPQPQPLVLAAGESAIISGLLYRLPEGKRLLVASAPFGPLQPSAPPSVEQIPNNHLAYAVQWFAFALLLPVIYFLWLRQRGRGG